MKIFVTGGSGFIGARIVELALQGGHAPLAGVHSSRGIPRLARLGVDTRSCDIMDPSLLAVAFADVDAVVHCAMADGPSVIEGTRNVLNTCKKLKISRVVFISTVDVYGDQEGEIDEATLPEKNGYWYNEAKVEAEKVCDEFGDGMNITILRPAIVYGPFCKPWTHRYYERFQAGTLNLVEEDKNGYCNAVYVDDVAGAALAAATKDDHAGGIYNVVGPDRLSWNEYFSIYKALLESTDGNQAVQGQRLKRKENIFLKTLRGFAKWMMAHFPKTVKYCYTQIPPLKSLMKKAERAIKSNPDSRELTLYARKARYSSVRIKAELDFAPKVGIEEGMRRVGNYLDIYFK